MNTRRGGAVERGLDVSMRDILHEAPRKGDISYLQALKSTGGERNGRWQKTNPGDKFPGFVYKSSEYDRTFLKQCFTGQLKEEYPWTDIEDEIQEIGEERFQIKYIGGDLVFIYPIEEQIIESKDLELISKWFEYLEPWSVRDAHNVRLVWTQWFGVPMHAWNPNFFKLVSLKFGKMLRIDDNTISKKNVQMARVLIKTPYSEISRDPFPVMVDDRKFFIRIKEESKVIEDYYADWSEGEVLVSDVEL
ncbi:hypothetical protein ACS0TY_021845 [Phlomoides rotata]